MVSTRSKGPSQDDDEKEKRIRELEEQLDRQTKRAKTAETEKKKATKTAVSAKASMNSIALEYTCPISHELMIDPVTAEDGFQYEREDIERTIAVQGDELKSPKTGIKMGPKLLPAVTVRNTIEHLVESGAIDGQLAEQYKQSKLVLDTKKKAEGGDIEAMESMVEWYNNGVNGLPEDKEKAEEWKEKVKDAKYVRELKEKAEGGDAEAMCVLARCYDNSSCGLPLDAKEAFRWYKKSADLRHPMGMALAGAYIRYGYGGAEKNTSLAVSLVTMAAELGADYACYDMGDWYMNGKMGLPKDKEQAKYWLGKCTDDSCEYKNLREKDINFAKEWIQELEGEEKA